MFSYVGEKVMLGYVGEKGHVGCWRESYTGLCWFNYAGLIMLGRKVMLCYVGSVILVRRFFSFLYGYWSASRYVYFLL